MSYGVTETGFVAKTLAEIKAEIEADLRATFGNGINLAPQSNFGQFVGIFAAECAELWELAEAVYNAQTPDGATGASLVHVASITGTSPEPAVRSRVIAVAKGLAGTVLPAGRVASVNGNGTRFESADAVTLALPAAWSPTTEYAVGAVRSNGVGAYYCAIGGVSAVAGGPVGTDPDVPEVDGTATWVYIGEPVPCAPVLMVAQSEGPLLAPAGTLEVIETPVAGWESVTNPIDATAGRLAETDPELRLRRELELRAQGNAAIEAIRQRVLALDDVTACRVFENDTDATDADGVPPHSVEVLVQGGDDDEIAAAIFASKAGGIRTHGGVTKVVTDADGQPRTIRFSRPTALPIYVSVTVARDLTRFPADGLDQIRAAIIARGNRHAVGESVVRTSLYGVVFGVSGVTDVTELLIGTTITPGLANVAVGSRQVAVFDTTRVSVSVA